MLFRSVGKSESCARGLREFLDQCAASGWTSVFHQVRDKDRKLLEDAGLRFLKIGEEAIVQLDEMMGTLRRTTWTTMYLVQGVTFLLRS